tara:strand:+ start:938 stop:1609 length:672 start_codon:yes stop_codon:yes gene_type:complete
METNIFDIIPPLIVTLIAASFSIRTFYQKKQYELVLKRYLEGSVDLLAADIQEIAGIFAHNWARCLAVSKSYRDAKEHFDISELNDGFLPMKAANFNIIAHYRLRRLTGTADYWHYYQRAISFYSIANSELTKEIPEAIRGHIAGVLGDTPFADVESKLFEMMKKRDAESDRYIALINEFQHIAASLESANFTFKEIDKFKEKKNVRILINRIEKMYGELESA